MKLTSAEKRKAARRSADSAMLCQIFDSCAPHSHRVRQELASNPATPESVIRALITEVERDANGFESHNISKGLVANPSVAFDSVVFLLARPASVPYLREERVRSAIAHPRWSESERRDILQELPKLSYGIKSRMAREVLSHSLTPQEEVWALFSDTKIFNALFRHEQGGCWVVQKIRNSNH